MSEPCEKVKKLDLLWALNALLDDDSAPPSPTDHLLDGSGNVLTDGTDQLTNG